MICVNLPDGSSAEVAYPNKGTLIAKSQLESRFKEIIAIKIPDEINSSNPDSLKRIASQLNFKCRTAPNIKSAITKLSSKKEKVIVCFGSLYLAGKILSLN